MQILKEEREKKTRSHKLNFVLGYLCIYNLPYNFTNILTKIHNSFLPLLIHSLQGIQNIISDATGLIKQLLCPTPVGRATVTDICVHWWVNFGYEQSPSQITEAYAGAVDRHSLIESLQAGVSVSGVSNNQSTGSGDHRHKHSKKQHKKTSDTNSGNNSPPLKGILKKPHNSEVICSGGDGQLSGKSDTGDPVPENYEEKARYQHHNETRLKKPRSNCELNSDWLMQEVFTSDNHTATSKKTSTLENRRSAPISCDIAKAVFDSTKKPKKSILKNRNGNSRSDSGCVIDEQMNIYNALENFEVVYPFTSTDSSSSSNGVVPGVQSNHSKQRQNSDSRENNQRDSAYIERKQSCDSELGHTESNSMFDLNDIESVLDDIVNFEVSTKKRLAHGNRDNCSNTTDSTMYSKGNNSSNYDCPEPPAYTVTPDDYSNYDPMKEPVKYRNKTSTPNRPLKSILKRNSRSKENSWRYSCGSQGSNSSGDILDFSYDSNDGEHYMQEFCAVPIPLNDDEEEQLSQDLSIHKVGNDSKKCSNKRPSSDPPPYEEAWSGFDVVQWPEAGVSMNDSLHRKSLKECEVPLNVEQYDNVTDDNIHDVFSQTTSRTATNGKQSPREQYDNVIDVHDNIVTTPIHENVAQTFVNSIPNLQHQKSKHHSSHLKPSLSLVVHDLKDSASDNKASGAALSPVKVLETPPPLPERPPPIGAPASPVRYRVTPPPTPPPLPENPPPPFKAFELDIFEMDAFNLDQEPIVSKRSEDESIKSDKPLKSGEVKQNSPRLQLVSDDIETPDYDKVFDALEKEAEAKCRSISEKSSQVDPEDIEILDSPRFPEDIPREFPHSNSCLDKDLLAQMQAYFETDDSLMDYFGKRCRSKSHSAQAISETEKQKHPHPGIRPRSKELQDTLDFYNLEVYEPFLHVSLHISEDDLIRRQSLNLESKVDGELTAGMLEPKGKCVSSCSETDEELVHNIKEKMLLHIANSSSAENDTGNESLAVSSQEDLETVDSELMELFIEEDTMQNNQSEPALSTETAETLQVIHHLHHLSGNDESSDNSVVMSSPSHDTVANESGAGDVEYRLEPQLQQCVHHSLPCLVITEQDSNKSERWDNISSPNSGSKSRDSSCSPNVVQDRNTDRFLSGSNDLYIDEDNLVSAISNISDSVASSSNNESVKSRGVLNREDRSGDKHYLDDIMEKIDLLGEQLESELMGSTTYRDNSQEDILIDFEEASEVCRKALKVCENL